MEKKYKLYSFLLWLFFLTPISLIALIFYYASIGGFGDMPDLEVLENPKTNLASEVISSDGKTLGKYYFNDNRTPVTFDELPKHLVDALIATEDIRFYSHSGIDFKRTFGAALKLGKDGGGSTITQQLAKLLFIPKLGDKNIYPKIFCESFLSRAEVELIVPPVEEDIKITLSPIFEPISIAS